MKPTTPLRILALALLLAPAAPAKPAAPKCPHDLPGPAAADTPLETLLHDAAIRKWRKTVPAFRRLALRDEPPPEAFQIAFERARDEYWVTRLAALEFLSEKAAPAPELTDLLQTCLGDDAWMVRVQAMEAVGLLHVDTPLIRACLATIAAQDATNAPGLMAAWTLRQLDPPPPAAAPLAPAGTAPLEFADSRFAVFHTASADPGRIEEILAVLGPATDRIARDLGRNGTWTETMPVIFYSDPDADRRELPESLAQHLPATNRIHGLWLDQDQILLMTTDWGGGILVHELVHARLSFDMLADPRANRRNPLPVWAGEGLAAAYEGNIRESTNSGGKALVLLDSRHASLVAALRRLENPGQDPGDGLQDRLPPALPPLTLDWLFGLGDLNFTHYYQHVRGSLSIALAREWILYLRDQDAVAPWFAALREGVLARRTSAARTWIAKELAWDCARQALPGRTREEIEAGFRAWVLNREISDGDALAHIEPQANLGPFELTGESPADASSAAAPESVPPTALPETP